MRINGHVITGISGGIAAYKACDLIRLFVKDGYKVHPVMTPSATKFITPLTIAYLASNKVHHDVFDEKIDWDVEHVSLADQADLMVIAPATANIIAKIAGGNADDFLSLTALTFAGNSNKPLLVAPAMNFRMYRNPVTQENIRALCGRGVHFIEPEIGSLACGEFGEGRLASIDSIYAMSLQLLAKRNQLKNTKVVVTAGGTREPIDPVRVISNRSSGKMGYAIALEFVKRGAEVTLVSSADLLNPGVHKVINFETAEQLQNILNDEFNECDILVMAAAVADFKVASISDTKIKRKSDEINLTLIPTIDIIAGLAEKKTGQFIVGFAAESNNLIENAKAKLKNKKLDMIVANDISRNDIAFNSDSNEVVVIFDDQQEHLAKSSKIEIAEKLVDRIVNEMNNKK